MGSTAKSFRTILERIGDGPHWVVAGVPVDLKKAWPAWPNRRVRGTINGFAFQTSLFPSKERGFLLVVNKKMQVGAKAGPGDVVQVRLEPDFAERSYVEPRELTRVLREDRQLRKAFDAMSPSMRRGFSFLVDQAKSAQTRVQRAERIAEALMQALEGEKIPPPILRAAFLRQPLAQQGWSALTPKQRRAHLLGIFVCTTVDAQMRRAALAVQACARAARRKSPEG